MFLVSGPDLVVSTCKNGVVGAFPALNQRTSRGYGDWLDEISERLVPGDAPFATNLIVNSSNTRLELDLATTVEKKVPLVITSLGASKEVVDAIHGYGGIIFHDVTQRRHAEKAAEIGVDGIIAVCAGAGGHGGGLSPFALVPEIRRFFNGTIILAGAISNGRHVAAARMIGADLAYVGTRFLGTAESLADPAHKRMLVAGHASDILYTDAISGVSANFLKPSLQLAGLDPKNMPSHEDVRAQKTAGAWKDVWSAGQGIGSIDDIPTAGELCSRMEAEYLQAMRSRTFELANDI